MIKIYRTDSNDRHFKSLISFLDRELHDNYGNLQDTYDTYNKVVACNTVIIARDDNKVVGCGCFRKHDSDTAEIKRMFVRKDYRGQGISKTILGELETWAFECGFSHAILETGTRQIEAIGLYKKLGYQPIENYGQYRRLDTSICMKKKISGIK